MKKRFLKTGRSEHGTVRFIENNMEDHIAAYWGSKEVWQAIPSLAEFSHFTDWDTVIPIDHGYDGDKPETELNLRGIQKAAKFRSGQSLSADMKTGNWTEKLRFRCAFGHEFDASPRLILEGGHWCPVCERESWNYYERAKVDPFGVKKAAIFKTGTERQAGTDQKGPGFLLFDMRRNKRRFMLMKSKLC